MSDEEISQLAPMADVVVVKFAGALPQHCGGVASKAARQSVGRAAWRNEHEIGCTAPEWEFEAPTRWK
jgi:hypothetical protein